VKKHKVIIRHCDSYDVARIQQILLEGLEELDLRPQGRTLIKPNVVAAGPLFKDAHTRPEFVEAMLLALQARDNGEMSELAVGERCGITVPTRTAFDGAGMYPVFKRTGCKHYLFEEEPQVEIPLTHETRLRDYVFTPEPVARADFFVNCPKFKSHPWTTVTFAMKNYIGIQDDRHRLIDHDHRLNDKIRDLQYIVQPQFIAIDGIIAGEGRMLTPIPRDLKLIVMGNNSVAFDTVCCHIIGIDPEEVDHIRYAREEGFGPTDLDQIEISGDITFEDAKKRGEGFGVGLIRVDKYFEGTNITAYAGKPPEPEHTDYCWGGCPGALEEAIEILRLFDEKCDERMPRMHIVFGNYDGPIDAKDGEQVVFIGDCAQWEGTLGDKLVRVESLYKDRSTKDPHTIQSEDIYKKMMTVIREAKQTKNDPHMRITGCPVSVAEQVLALVARSDINNPFFNVGEALRFNKGYLMWKSSTMASRLRGKPYQLNGTFCDRGRAAPELEESTASEFVDAE
jgi:uncharacterized protein (DUF362 family)